MHLLRSPLLKSTYSTCLRFVLQSRSCSPPHSPNIMAFWNDYPSGRGLWRARILLPIIFVIAMFGLWPAHSRLAKFPRSDFGDGKTSKSNLEASDKSFLDIQNSNPGVSAPLHAFVLLADSSVTSKFERLFIINLPGAHNFPQCIQVGNNRGRRWRDNA